MNDLWQQRLLLNQRAVSEPPPTLEHEIERHVILQIF